MSTSHIPAPVPVHVLRDLFDYVAGRLCPRGSENITTQCDHSLRYAREFIHRYNLHEDKVVAWLEDNGGFCDCEVLFNCASQFCDDNDDHDEPEQGNLSVM